LPRSARSGRTGRECGFAPGASCACDFVFS
jgi:hypothetical protein